MKVKLAVQIMFIMTSPIWPFVPYLSLDYQDELGDLAQHISVLLVLAIRMLHV